ncbi:hypothetical protein YASMINEVIRUS_228 [Yasminevirus sp. GU-2018]|uniref:Uncharacterized protein n=1 Tax=Yasminevirus sp. GU-2018 TaxID=2420051 RepID=A0A5K0U7M2_9VIRU|nr:hypothetical protein YASMINEVIRUS_228 [Yasminevirus sp. GU-2018]
MASVPKPQSFLPRAPVSNSVEIETVLSTLTTGTWQHDCYLYYKTHLEHYALVKLFSTGTGFCIQKAIYNGEKTTKKEREQFSRFMHIVRNCLPKPKTDLVTYRGDREYKKVDRRTDYPFYSSFDITVALGYHGRSSTGVNTPVKTNNPLRCVVIKAGTSVGYHHYLQQIILPGGTLIVEGSSFETDEGIKMVNVNYTV